MADAKILEKGLRLIEELAQSNKGKTAQELADHIGIHKTSVYRYLNTLSEMGYIRANGDGGYHLANKILELGSHMLSRMPLREMAHPFLIELGHKTQKTVHLCVLDRMEVVYLDKIESQRSLPIISRIGSRAPAYCTAVGKALLSGLSTDLVVSLLEGVKLEPLTPNTITDPIRLLEEIRNTSKRGYAIDDGEHEVGIKCVAAPVRKYGGDVAGAVSVTGLKRELTDKQQLTDDVLLVMKTAEQISRAWGHAAGSS